VLSSFRVCNKCRNSNRTCKDKGKAAPVRNGASRYEDVWVRVGIGPRILNLSTRWTALRPCRFTPGEILSGTHWIGGWMGPRIDLDVMAKKGIPCPWRESNSCLSACELLISDSFWRFALLMVINYVRTWFLSWMRWCYGYTCVCVFVRMYVWIIRHTVCSIGPQYEISSKSVR
jgi:hypothetical protein